MVIKTDDFRFDSRQSKKAIVDYLDALIDGFRKRNLTVGDGEREITLRPSGLIEMELKVRHSGAKNRLSLDFKWKEISIR